jgi:hypothetical protein
MESRWRDWVTLDYEIDFPEASRFEVAVYGAGAAAFPRVVLGVSSSWGIHRRPGVLDIPRGEYTARLNAFSRLSTDLEFAHGLSRRFDSICGALAALNQNVERSPDDQTADSISALIDQLVELMAFHVLNWAIPLKRFRRILADVLGDDKRAGESLMRLFVSFRPAHLSDFAETALAAAQKVGEEDWSERDTAELFTLVDALQAESEETSTAGTGGQPNGFGGFAKRAVRPDRAS